MKTKYRFEIMELDDGLVAVPVGAGAEQFQGVLKLNETAKSIIELLENETTEEEIVNSLLKEYDGDSAQISSCVHEYIEKLSTEGLLV